MYFRKRLISSQISSVSEALHNAQYCAYRHSIAQLDSRRHRETIPNRSILSSSHHHRDWDESHSIDPTCIQTLDQRTRQAGKRRSVRCRQRGSKESCTYSNGRELQAKGPRLIYAITNGSQCSTHVTRVTRKKGAKSWFPKNVICYENLVPKGLNIDVRLKKKQLSLIKEITSKVI